MRSSTPPLLLTALLSSACGGAEASSPPPNVILISIDSLRADHVGCYGYGRNTTPHLDRFAREGVVFEQHISSSSWTLPAHAALFTSVPDSVHGCVEATGTALNPAFVTLAERFREGGYEAAGFYAGPYMHEAFGLGQGFEPYLYCVEYRESFDSDAVEQWGNDGAAHARSHQGTTNEALYGAAAAWIEEHKQRPFFAFLHFWDVHFDFTPPPPWDTRFDPGYDGPIDGRNFFSDHERYNPAISPADLAHLIALYDGEIGWTDSFLGRLREALEEWGLAENTLVVVTSDHGTEFFDHGWKGHRHTLFDELVRTPLVLWFPKRFQGGRKVEEQTRIIDVAPTLLELAGLAPLEVGMGSSLVGLADGGALDFENRAVCELYSVGRRLRAVRTATGKLMHDEHNTEQPKVWFDLTGDPREQRPRTGFDDGPGRDLRRDYLRALAEIERALERRPGNAVDPELSERILRELESNGYVGGDEEED